MPKRIPPSRAWRVWNRPFHGLIKYRGQKKLIIKVLTAPVKPGHKAIAGSDTTWDRTNKLHPLSVGCRILGRLNNSRRLVGHSRLGFGRLALAGAGAP